jgi:hypothetical protein
MANKYRRHLTVRMLFLLLLMVAGTSSQLSAFTHVYRGASLTTFEEVQLSYNEIIAQQEDEKPGIVFSVKPGFYSEQVELVLSHPDPEAAIFYTTDGSIPSGSSLQYTSPVLINNRSNEPNQHSMIPTNFITGWRGWLEPDGLVAKGTIIRAVAVKNGSTESPVKTGTWFIFPEGDRRYSIDVVSIVTEHDNFFSDETGIYVPGNTYEQGRPQTGNYAQRGIEWERPVSIELFGDDLTFQQDIGVRIHGGWTRRDPVKSLRLYARSDYGESRFNYRIFPELPYTNYNRLLLRQSGNDWASSLIRDAVAHHLVRHFDLDVMAYSPNVVFINGEYWGIKNFRERFDRHYLERVYRVDPDNIDLLTGRNEVQEGDNNHYNQLIDFVSINDLADDSNYQQVVEMMDINNYLDYYSAEIYFQNTDWPTNNIDFWRTKVDFDPGAPKGHDGRWRWLFYDVDRAFGLFESDGFDYNYNMMEHVTRPLSDDREWPNLLFRNLLENESFRHDFINRTADHINTAFLPSRVKPVIDSFAVRIEPEIDEYIKRWRYPETRNHWESQIRRMHRNAENRPEFVIQHLMDHFGITERIDLTVSTDLDQGWIRVNSIDINPSTPGISAETYPWTGMYFQGIPIRLEALPREGYEFSHWSGTGIDSENQNNRILTITPSGDMTLEAHYSESEVPDIISFWFFGEDLPNDMPLDTIVPTYLTQTGSMITFESALDGYPYTEEHELWRKSSLERRNEPTDINYHSHVNNDIPFGESNMRGIQVRQPLSVNGNESALVIHVPTHGYHDAELRFAAMDEGAAEKLIIEYSINSGDPVWTGSGLESGSFDLYPVYQLYRIDLAEIEGADNNPDFKLRLRFQGENNSADEGNRVTFNNFSLHGFPLNAINFYTKSVGSLTDLTTWGTEPDGSGEPPPSFDLNAVKYHIHNRDSDVLDADWQFGGKDSRVILGDGTNNYSLRVNSEINAVIDVRSGSTLELTNSVIPELGIIEDGSSLILAGETPTIPYVSFYNLTINSINPVFDRNGTIRIRGNLSLEGSVTMPDARGAAEYSIRFSGSSDQSIEGNGNILRGYDITFDKSGGAVSFSEAGGGTVLSADNQLRMTMAGDAMFTDNGIMIYAGNSVNIAGNPEAYDFTGTLILAGTEEGIVNGAGSENNFNVRDSNRNNSNMAAALNNLIIRANNENGEFRFRDGTGNLFIIKGDLIVESGAAGRIRFFENELQIGGNLIIEEGFSGPVDHINTIRFKGTKNQTFSTPNVIQADNLILENPDGLTLDGSLQINNSLIFEAGSILVMEGNLPRLGTGAQLSGYSEQNYIEGPLGRYFSGTIPEELVFPIGGNGSYRPFIMEISHFGEGENFYVSELINENPPEKELAGLERVTGNYYYNFAVSGNADIKTSTVTIFYDPSETDVDEEMLRIAKSDNGTWINMGGSAENGQISSVVPVTSSGSIALAGQLNSVVSVYSASGPGGIIDPEGLSFVTPGTDLSFSITADDDYHIENVLIDGEPVSDVRGSLSYEYTFTDIQEDVQIIVEFGLITGSDLIGVGITEVKIFPNPATDFLWIEFGNDHDLTAFISLMDLNGRVVSEKTLQTSQNNTGSLALSGITPGLYILKIVTGKEQIFRRIIVF